MCCGGEPCACMASLVSIPDDIRGIVCTYLPAEDLICMARCLSPSDWISTGALASTWLTRARVSRVCRKAVRAARCVWSSTPLRWGHLRALTSVLSPQLTVRIGSTAKRFSAPYGSRLVSHSLLDADHRSDRHSCRRSRGAQPSELEVVIRSPPPSLRLHAARKALARVTRTASYSV